MQVIAHQPHHWFLLVHNKNYIFDVNINVRFVSYSINFYLNQKEIDDYLLLGNEFLNELALKIEGNLNSTNSPFINRMVKDKDLSDCITQANVQWRKEFDSNL